MTEDDDVAARDRREMRVMWGFSAAIVLLILGGMGANMICGLRYPGNPAESISAANRARAPPNSRGRTSIIRRLAVRRDTFALSRLTNLLLPASPADPEMNRAQPPAALAFSCHHAI